MPAAPISLRWMIRRDLSDVGAIERAVFEFPWSEREFARRLRQKDVIGLVAAAGDRDEPIGYVLYELHPARIHVVNLAVAPSLQRLGVGTALVAKLQQKLAAGRRTRITLEVRETNLAAQTFCAAAGFRATAVLRDWYEDTDEDAYLFAYRVGDAAPDAPAIPRRTT